MTTFKRLQFCICPLLAATAIAAETFSGRVVDRETGTGLANVSITLLSSDENATTDQNGQFSFSREPVDAGRFRRGNRDLLKWRGTAHLFDLKSAPGMTSVALYDLKGGRLFFKTRTPGSDLLQLPAAIPDNLYLLRVGKSDGKFYTVKWVNMGDNAVFTLGVYQRNGGSLPKRAAIVDSLVFEKQEYQTRKIAVDSDSTYASMLVKMKPEIGSRIFDDDTVRTYRLYFTEENLALLLDFSKLVTNTYTVNSVFVPARLVMEGRSLDSIGVRFRGDQSIWDCISNGKRKKGVTYPQFGFGNGDICAKFSMKFDFNRYNADLRLYGLKALNFRSMSADPTKIHEKLGFSLFADMDIVSPRSAYAKLYVNDTLWGLFGVAEEIDGRFTKSRYPATGDGNLYKEIWPETQLTDASIFNALTTNNDPEDAPDISDFKELRDSISASGTDSSTFLEKINPLVDIPRLVRYIVVDRGIMNFDGIMSNYGGGYGRHNYFWYHDDDSGLFKLIPWDLDKALLYPEPNFWTNNAPVGKNLVPNWNVINSTYSNITCVFDPGSSGGGYKVTSIDKDKFLRLFRSATWNDFCSQGRFFLDSIFTETRLNPRIAHWRTIIAGAVGEDPTIDSAEWTIMVDSLSHTIPLWRKNLEMMIDTLIVR
ncbi:MAG: CotH kinase family protein [Chitinispirillaceae bacterium]|nr:CotH kinase family protein [Chitinispirillaceae bacterium]